MDVTNLNTNFFLLEKRDEVILIVMNTIPNILVGFPREIGYSYYTVELLESPTSFEHWDAHLSVKHYLRDSKIVKNAALRESEFTLCSTFSGGSQKETSLLEKNRKLPEFMHLVLIETSSNQ